MKLRVATQRTNMYIIYSTLNDHLVYFINQCYIGCLVDVVTYTVC